MTEALDQYGFKFVGTCNCNGQYTHKYKNNAFKINWIKGARKFSITKYGRAVTNNLPEANIIDELEKILPLQKAV